MSNEMNTIIGFCLEHAGQVSMPRQVLLYRALAEFCGDATDAALFRRMADEIESAEKARGQLSFKWKPKHEPGISHDGENSPENQ